MTKIQRALTTRQVADYCSVSFRTVIRWIERGELKAYQLPGRGDNRIALDDFLEFLRKHDMPVPAGLASERERRVLVVDDDARMTAAIERVLKAAGYQVQTALDGFHAGSQLETFRPLVMTLDLRMPGMDGLEVVRFVRKTYPTSRIRILVVSALPARDLRAAIEAGADDILEKPFENRVLLERVARLADPAYAGGPSTMRRKTADAPR